MKVSLKVHQYRIGEQKGYVLIVKLRRYTFAYDHNHSIVPRLVERYYPVIFKANDKIVLTRKSTFRIDFGVHYYALVSFLHLLSKGKEIERSVIDVEPTHLWNCLNIVFPLITNIPKSIKRKCEESTDCTFVDATKVIQFLENRLNNIPSNELAKFIINSKVIPK